MASKTTHPAYNVATDQILVSNQAQYNQNQGWVPYQHIGAGTGTLTPYPYGGVLIQTGSGGYISGGVAQQLDPYVPYVIIDTRVEFSEEEIMKAEQIMEECDAARTP